MNYWKMSRISGFVDRACGTGRPTKKDNRRHGRIIILNISVMMTSTLNLISKNKNR